MPKARNYKLLKLESDIAQGRKRVMETLGTIRYLVEEQTFEAGTALAYTDNLAVCLADLNRLEQRHPDWSKY